MLIGILVTIGLIWVFFFNFYWLNKAEKKAINALEDLKSRTTYAVNATVLGIKHESKRLSSDYNTYYYVVYDVLGNMIQSQVSVTFNWFAVGQVVLAYVNPYNYNEIYVPEEEPERAIRIYHIMKIIMIIGCIVSGLIGVLVTYLLSSGVVE